MNKAFTCPNCNGLLLETPTSSCPKCSGPVPTPDESTLLRADEHNSSENTLVYQASPGSGIGSASTFGNYELLGELGRGGMGVVYRARQKKAERMVALKVMRDHDRASEEEKERFTAEVRALARVSHPNIVQIFEVGEEDGCPFFTMEYVEGQPLSSRNRDEPMSAGDAARLIELLAGAVQAAHEVGVLHRDIKPSNVLMDSHDQPKLTDFGLAKHLDQDSGLTADGSALGTPSYMSPEQASGDLEKIAATADVYSLGATLYELQTGRPPFRGETPGGTLAKVLKEDVIPPSRIRPELSPELEAVCLKCLEKNPARRYGTSKELAEELGRWRNGEATRVRPWSWRRRMHRQLRRHWKPIAVVSTVLLMVAAFVYTFIITDPEYRNRQAMQAVDRAVQRGERVELVGPTGPPKWLRKVVDIDATLSSDPDRVFQVKANNAALIELAPAAHHDSYRINCEVRTRTSGNADSSSGIYFAHNQVKDNSAGFAERLIVLHHFRNRDEPQSEAFVNVHDYLHQSKDGISELRSSSPFGAYLYTIDRQSMSEPWRFLEVEVTPEAIHAYWRDADGSRQLVGRQGNDAAEPIPTRFFELTVDSRRQTLEQAGYGNVQQQIDYEPRGGFGLFVQNAVVEFRNVIYEAIP